MTPLDRLIPRPREVNLRADFVPLLDPFTRPARIRPNWRQEDCEGDEEDDDFVGGDALAEQACLLLEDWLDRFHVSRTYPVGLGDPSHAHFELDLLPGLESHFPANGERGYILDTGRYSASVSAASS